MGRISLQGRDPEPLRRDGEWEGPAPKERWGFHLRATEASTADQGLRRPSVCTQAFHTFPQASTDPTRWRRAVAGQGRAGKDRFPAPQSPPLPHPFPRALWAFTLGPDQIQGSSERKENSPNP